MASPKKLSLTCTSINLLGDGRWQVQMEKNAESATSKTDRGATIVNPKEAILTVIADGTEGYSVGKEYTLTLNG